MYTRFPIATKVRRNVESAGQPARLEHVILIFHECKCNKNFSIFWIISKLNMNFQQFCKLHVSFSFTNVSIRTNSLPPFSPPKRASQHSLFNSHYVHIHLIIFYKRVKREERKSMFLSYSSYSLTV